MKILWVLDTEFSALSISARSKTGVSSQFVYADECLNLSELTKRLLSHDVDLVVFAWRKVLRDIINSRRSGKMISEFSSSTKIAILVPDLLGASAEGIQSDLDLFNAVDLVFTTSRQLFGIYFENLGHQKKILLLRDTIPVQDEISYLHAIDKKPEQVIWVGNSKWGSKQGLKDHKGFFSVIKPLSEMCRASGCSHTYLFIDSAVKRAHHDKVMEAIRESGYLLQSSFSEGTGMPVLEAMAMGTVPITTNVGIAGEILMGDLSILIADRTPESFFSVLHDPRTREMVNSKELSIAYNKYLTEPVPFDYSEVLNIFPTRKIKIPRNRVNLRLVGYPIRYLFRCFRLQTLVHK